jgi:hypothetical protein
MTEIVLCSNCFNDQGLRLTAFNIGIDKNSLCPRCKTKNGRKLNKELVKKLAYSFFVRGTVHRAYFGSAPVIQFNEQQYENSSINIPKRLEDDIKLIEDTIKVGFFYYGPRLWMIGEVEPLKKLELESERHGIIHRILKEYPARIILKKEFIYRLRKEPKDPSNFEEYDSPPLGNENLGKGRFDSINFPIMYASQDLEICVHECRVTVDDNLFLATLYPTRDLKLLDLTEILDENETEFESLDMAVHMLFFAGECSYKITREIAFNAYKAGFDGLIYPSYFSLFRTGAMPFDSVYGISVRKFPSYKNHAKSQIIQDMALFGRPIEKKIIAVKCINRLVLNKVKYDIRFGPVDY